MVVCCPSFAALLPLSAYIEIVNEREGDRILVAILASPPTTDGTRTLRRLELARVCLGFDEVTVVNLFPLPTYRTGDISRLGMDDSVWHSARPSVEAAMKTASALLLGYGITEPAGLARRHHRDQVAWLREQQDARHLDAYQVGGSPRHPSRWQRWTSRAHPTLAFGDALRLGLAID